MQHYWSDEDVLLAGQQALTERIPGEKLLGYLEGFQNDLLTTGTANGLPSFSAQRDMLVAAMHKKYADGHGYHQTIKGTEVGVPKFLELMLSMDFVSHEIKLANNIGYVDREIFPGIRSTAKLPYAEFTIIGEDLKQVVMSKVEPVAPEADVFMRGGFVCIAITGHEIYRIAKLEQNGSYHLFMDYLLATENADVDITIDEIKKLKGLAASKDLTEIARHCGFDKVLKKAFFTTCKEDKIRFTSNARLDNEQVEAVKRQAAKLESKDRK
jgi:hypothetical protein